MTEELIPLFNQYKSVNPNVTEEMFNTSYNLLGDKYVQIIQDELKKKVDPQEQEILSETQIDSNSINSATPNVLATPISNDLQLNEQQVEILNQQQPQNSTVLDSTGNQSLLVSESTSPSSSNIDLKEISEPVLNPTQVIPDFNNIIKPKNNTLEVLAGKDTTTSPANNFPIPTLDQVEADKQAKATEEIKTSEFLKQYSDKDYLNAKIPFVEKGIEYTSWSTTPEQVKESNDRLAEAERNGDVYLKAGENGGIAKDERGNYKYEILTDSYKDNFNQYINELNSAAGQENINRARFNQGNIFNTPEQSESVEYLNSLQKEYGIVFTNDQVDQLINPNSRKQLEINLETERRLKENPNLYYNSVLQQVTSEKQGLSEQQKFSVGNSYVRDFFLESPENYTDDEKDEYRFYQNYFSNQNNIAEFGDFMNDYGKAIFDTSWIKSNQTKKEQERRKEMFETFLSWKGKNDRLDLELSQRGFENTKAKADGYKSSNNQEAYQQEFGKMNDYLNTYNQSFDKLKSRNEEFQNIQNNYSKTLKKQEEKANFQLRVQSGETSANIQNVVGNVVLGAETSIQNAATGLLRIAAIPLGKGNVNDAIDILSKPISIGNIDIARISDRVINYEKGTSKYKEVNGTLYGINSDGSLYRPKQNISRESLVKTGEDAEYNFSGIAFVTSKMLADIYITQATGTAIGNTLGKISNAVSNSQKINAVFGEASQLAKSAASYARMAQNPTSVMVNGWTVQMYNDNYLAAQNGGIESTINKHLYAFTTSFALAQIQRINPDTNFLKTINSEQKAIVSALMEGNTQKAILGIQSFAKKAATNTGKELIEENVQQATQDIINIAVNSVGDKKLQVSDVQDYKDVFVGTVIPSIIASGLGGRVRQAEVGGRNIDLTQLTRNELVTELARTDQGIALLQNFKENAFFDSQKVEAENILNEVKERQKYINKIPDSENYSTETINQVIPLLQEIDSKKAKLNSTEETFKDRIQQDVQNLSTEVNSILDNDKNNDTTTQPTQESEAIQEQATVIESQSQQVETPTINEVSVGNTIEEINKNRQNEIDNYTRPFSFEDYDKTPQQIQEENKLAIQSINDKYDAQIQNLESSNQEQLTPAQQANVQIERLQQLPLTNEEDYNEAQNIINNIDFNNEESISDGISKLGNLISGKDLSKTKTTAEKYIKGKEKQIGNIDTRTKEYLDFYINTIYRDFSNNPDFFNETQNNNNQSQQGTVENQQNISSDLNTLKNETAQNNQNVTQQTTSETPSEFGNQTNEPAENIQPTESKSNQANQNIQIDENLFNDNTDLTEEQLIQSDKQVSDAISLFESFNNPKLQPTTENSRLSSNGKYNVVERISENGNTTFDLLDYSNNPVNLTNKQKDVYVAEYINSKEYPVTNIDINGIQPNELTQEIIRNTQDPKELAQIIISTPQFDSQSVVGSKDWAISQVIGRNNVSRKSFIENDDANNITNAIGRTYFGKNKTGKSLDNIAQEASEQFTSDYNDDSVTIQDIVDFIKSYPNDPSKAERPDNPLYDEAVSKFIQLTGQNPTKNLLDKLIPAQNLEDKRLNLQSAESEYNNLTSEQQNQLSQEYDNWFNSLSNEQKQEELNKTYPDYEQSNRQNNIESENQYTPNAEGESNQNVSNEGSAQRQQTNESLTTISESEFNSLIEQLKKPFKNAFKNLNVTTNLEEATQRARELGENTTDLEFTNSNDNVYGFKLSDGTIYINPTNLNANTPIHEFSHLWEQLMPNAWKNGLTYFKDTATGKRIFNQLKSESNYSNLTDDQIWSEALNTHIGNYGEWINNNPKGKMKEFADWIKRTFAKIGNYFGIKTNPEISLRNFTEGVIGDLLGGRELNSESNQQIKQNEELKKYLKEKLNVPQNIIDALPKDLSITYKILMGNPSMSLNERLKQTRNVAAQTELNNLQIFAKDGSIKIEKIGTIRANLLITLKYYLTGSNRKNTDIFHEVVHAGTLLTMKDIEYYKNNSKYRETNKYTQEQIEAYDNILFNTEYFSNLYKESRKKVPFGTSIYGLNNPYEFVAEFMSNPNFKEWILDKSNDVLLRKTLQEKGELKGGILRNIWDNIKILLGIKNKEIDTELNKEINSDINTILEAQKNNLENFVSFSSDINPAQTGIQFSKGNINKNVIPKSTFAKVVNATSTEGKQAGFDELINSSWFNGLNESIKSNTTVNNFHNLMLNQAKLIQENDAVRRENIRKQASEKTKEKVAKVKQDAKEKIADIIDKYKTKIAEIKADAKKSARDKSLEQKRALRTAVKDIKSHLASNLYIGRITPSETNRLIRKASEIGSRKDISAAVNEFTKLYDDIRSKAESRLKQKEFTLDEYNELKTIIEESIDNSKSLADIYNAIRSLALSNKRAGVLNEMYETQIENIYNEVNNERLTTEEAYAQMKSKQNEALESMQDKRNRQQKIKSAVRAFIKYVSDRQYLPKKLLQEIGANNTVNRMITMAGASSRASEIYSQLEKKIFKGLKLEDKTELNAMIIAKRILAIEKNRAERGLPPIKHPYANPAKALEEMKSKLGDEKYSDLENRATEYFKAFKNILGDMQNNGLISQDSYDNMIEIDYQPRLFIDRLLNAEGNLDEDGNFQNFSGQNGGLKSEIMKSLDGGSDSAIIDNAEWLLKTALSSRYKAMAMNEVNRRFMTDEFWKAKDRFDNIDPQNFANKSDQKFYEYFKELQPKIKDNPIVGITEAGNPKYQYDSTPQGFKKAYYYVDGVRNEFFLAEDFHQEWHDVKEGLIFDPQAKGLINKWSGAGLIKAMATGYNPTFAFTNTPRDFMQTLVFSPEYSNNLLMGTFQLGYDQVKAITRMFKSDFQGKEDAIFQKYIEYGGGMDFLHVQGLLDSEQKTSKAIQKVLDSNIFQVATLMKLSKWSEMMTRMAIFERSIQNQLKDLGVKSLNDISTENQKDDIYYQAVASARSIMDFNQGGKLTKDLDAVMPYLNAATQGTRVAVDAFRRDPSGTSIRMFQAGGLMASTSIGVSYALLAMAKGTAGDDDDKSINETILNAYDGLSQYQRANYINIVLPSKNEKGENYVFKIAKTQFVAPLAYMMEEGLLGVIRKIEGKPEKDFTKVIKETGWVANKNMTPIEFAKPQDFIASVATKNPLMKASLTYVTGYDFFKDEVVTFDIKKSNFPRELEGYKDDNVEDFYKGIGELTGGSPARTKAFVESIVTTPETNPFVTMIYGGADLTNAVIQGDSKTEVAQEVKENIAKVFTKRLIGQASDFNRMRREREDVEKEVNKAILIDEKIKIETDILAKKYSEGIINDQDIANKFNEMGVKDLDKAYNRLNDKIAGKASDTRIYDIKYSTSNSNVAKAILIKKYFPEVYENSIEGEAIRQELKQFKIYSKDIQQELVNIAENE